VECNNLRIFGMAEGLRRFLLYLYFSLLHTPVWFSLTDRSVKEVNQIRNPIVKFEMQFLNQN
jgi:hypothetical protein